MAWWIVVLLPVPVVAVLALVAVIATAFSISAEEDRRRLHLRRLAHQPLDVEAPSEVPTLGIVPETREQTPETPVERVSTLH